MEALTNEILTIAEQILSKMRVAFSHKSQHIYVISACEPHGYYGSNVSAHIDITANYVVITDYRRHSKAYGSIKVSLADPEFFTKLRDRLETIQSYQRTCS